MIRFYCHTCGRPYPLDTIPFVCPICGGFFDFEIQDLGKHLDLIQCASLNWMVQAIGIPGSTGLVSLGEGQTPLLDTRIAGRKIYLKLENLNPTASYKDRGSAILATFLKSRGVTSAIEDSSGNAGASFAAYAARAGITARIFVPEKSGGPKRRQIEAYGACITAVLGPRSNAARVAIEEALSGSIYASHAYQPHVLAGYLTLAFEIITQLKAVPGCIILPVGQGNLLYSLGKGFQFMFQAGYIDAMPALVGVQAIACAPLWAVSRFGAMGLSMVIERDTLAEGVKIKYPVRGDAVLQVVGASGGEFIAVEEEAIKQGRDELACRGFYVEPTSALIWDAVVQIGDHYRDPIVAVLTGSGLKTDF